jgi:spore coat protein A, manganese oxidase
MISRRQFLKIVGATGTALALHPALTHQLDLGGRGLSASALAQIAGGTLEPGAVDKYVQPLIKPPAMPKSQGSNKNKDMYRIGVRQFQQQILPSSLPKTTVWSYGSIDYPETFNYPAFTVEASANKTTQVLWRNELVDADGNFLPHLLPIDQTLHWANPPGGWEGRDHHGMDPTPYRGPVPIITHVHGAHTTEDSDGYPEAWYLPDARNIPSGYARTGTFFDYYNRKYRHNWSRGTVSFKYPNDQPAATLWYHDHTLGITRVNVYAGPAGFWLVRGGPYDMDLGYVAPGVGDDPLGEYTEIPIVIQDRSFNADGSLFYPDFRAFFEELNLPPDEPYLDIPFIPDEACDGQPSDVSAIWNPEFFGNMMVVNGSTWPYLDVEQRRYRLRFLNGCNSRFLILKMDNDMPIYQIGGDQGFLPSPVELDELLLAPAERADVIVDFTKVPVDTELVLLNLAPDEPFGGGIPGEDFDPADPDSTGQVMKFRVVSPASSPDLTTPPMELLLPDLPSLGPSSVTRKVSLNEEMSRTVRVSEDDEGNVMRDCDEGEEFGPVAALLGTVEGGTGNSLLWNDPITENPAQNSVETWEIHNFTEDAHPIHIHLVKFQVVGREFFGAGTSITGSNEPLPGERGFKDTVIAYPAEITRVKMHFDLAGYYVWHCHILEHEDNEMMRPFRVIASSEPMPRRNWSRPYWSRDLGSGADET